jgi:hypothetical protein
MGYRHLKIDGVSATRDTLIALFNKKTNKDTVIQFFIDNNLGTKDDLDKLTKSKLGKLAVDLIKTDTVNKNAVKSAFINYK